LSIIVNPKQHSHGQFKHYGEWIGTAKPLPFQEKLRLAIDMALSQKPRDMDTFLTRLSESGFEHKWGRGGVLSFRAEEQKRFTRLRVSTLGDGYGLDDILAVIDGKKSHHAHVIKTAPYKVNLIIDIQSKLNSPEFSGRLH